MSPLSLKATTLRTVLRALALGKRLPLPDNLNERPYLVEEEATGVSDAKN
jgi:hypothetical protein